MARLHSRKKGKSGRKLPKKKVKPDWVEVNKEEIIEVITKMAKEGVHPAKIGIVLRDEYAVPDVRQILGVRLTTFLRKNNLYGRYPADFLDLIKRSVRMNKHLKNAKKDIHNKTKYLHVISKINRLAKYLKKEGILPSDWKYNAEQAELLVK
ncbi:MAG: 30S ribosomal protein S15 [Candidatus Bilamarchaeaceae archaeon]